MKKALIFLVLLIPALSYCQLGIGYFTPLQTEVGFNPIQLDPVLYLDAGSNVTELGGAVSRWDSRVGSMFAEQLVMTSQPTLTESDTNYNNQPSISGVGHFMELTPDSNLTGGDFSVYIVAYFENGLNNVLWFRSSNGVSFTFNNEDLFFIGSGNTSVQVRDGVGAQAILFSTGGQGLKIISVRFKSVGAGTSTRIIDLNGVEIENVSNLNPVARDNTSVGIGQNLVNPANAALSVGEIIYYDYELNTEQHNLVKNFLNSKYSAY